MRRVVKGGNPAPCKGREVSLLILSLWNSVLFKVFLETVFFLLVLNMG